MADEHPGDVFHATLSSATKTYAVSDTPPVFVSGDGAWLTDSEGKRYLDFACGSGTTSLGHNHPAVLAAVQVQLSRGITHIGPHFHTQVQAELLELLRGALPKKLHRFHPATNGTEATETALKAVMHFTGHHTFLSFEGSYHGRTLGALAVSAEKGPNKALGPLKPDAVFLPYGCDMDALERAVDTSPPFAGIIVEPVQATSGMIVPRDGFLKQLAQFAEIKDIPLIFDEVFTGFGRTGRVFAFEHHKIAPDLLILGKAFGGGFPGGLVAGREDIMTAWRAGAQSSTFQLHPVTAAAAKASLHVMLEDNIATRAVQIEEWMTNIGADLTRHSHVADFRGTGAMFGCEIVDAGGRPDQPHTKAVRAEALAHGLVTWECGAQGNVIGLVPPLTVTETEVQDALARLQRAVISVSRKI